MSWTQSACDTCYAELVPGLPQPVRIKEPYRDTEVCCMCGRKHRSGIYVRLDPREVPYPKEETS